MREDWTRLGEFVASDRRRLGYETFEQWHKATGVSIRQLSDLENGRRVGPKTLAAVEAQLNWEPGSYRTVLQGGRPIYLNDGTTNDSPDDEFRNSLRVMRRAMGREAFLRWVDENSLPIADTEGDHAG